ncbi:hypothetical protein BD310DRAFT_365194 [Dichomitus squalens]|uniref:Uncharacterized protein n=1 Tax=Dichomitus squalens TaxID=114155 RepID=A0A4Q9PZ12_9APHY|nr:hypothetical protein BD310DRAFT_365194 [Dichomitus squalens]
MRAQRDKRMAWPSRYAAHNEPNCVARDPGANSIYLMVAIICLPTVHLGVHALYQGSLPCHYSQARRLASLGSMISRSHIRTRRQVRVANVVRTHGHRPRR